jgi:hypothetical protein
MRAGLIYRKKQEHQEGQKRKMAKGETAKGETEKKETGKSVRIRASL